MPTSSSMQPCIDACSNCHNTCKETMFQHCLEVGGKHVEKAHINLMVDCIEICQIAANLMLRGSGKASDICKICADICDDCANSCEALEDEKMESCAEACRDCADLCRNMGQMPLRESAHNLGGRA